MIFEWDDFGCNHEISAVCQSHDCRDQLLELKKVNPDFKATLFAIPGEMTSELLLWCKINKDWIELAVHGFYHTSNYECEKMTYKDFNTMIMNLQPIIDWHFSRGFRAPGWQISDDIYRWLKDHGWWVADQSYNNDRRPDDLKAYVNFNGQFTMYNPTTDIKLGESIDIPESKPGFERTYHKVEAYHGHTWNVGSVGSIPANGIYEDFSNVRLLVEHTKDFKFISELF